MSTLFIANKNYSSWSLRPWLLMRTLNIPFTEEIRPFESGSNWSQFRDFSPTGLVPCLVDQDRVIWDSLGITEYLAEEYPQVWPADSSARAWARCATAEMHAGFPALRELCPMNCGLRIELTDKPEALQLELKRLDELWNQGLQRFAGPFLAGSQFSAVDAFFAPVVFRIQTYGLELSEAALDYALHILSLEGMRDWQEAALNESWREDAHEQDALSAGRVLSDRRIT